MLNAAALRTLTSVTTLAILSLTIPKLVEAEDQKTTIDPVANARLKAMTGFYEELKTFSVDVKHEMKIPQQGKEAIEYSDLRQIRFKQPTFLDVTINDGMKGKLVCDGKQLFAYLPTYGGYLLVDAPSSLSELLQLEGAYLLGAGRTVVQLAAGGAYEQFTTSASNVTFHGNEEIDDTACDRIEISSGNAKSILWIEQGKAPLLRRMKWELDMDSPSNAMQMPSQQVTFSNWKIDESIENESFSIVPPASAEQVASFFTRDRDEGGPHPLLGKQAPECDLKLLDGEALKLASLEGKKAVVLDFWALWCGPCLDALPKVDKVASKFKKQDVAFFAVNIGDDSDKIHEYFELNDLQLPVALDSKSDLAELFQANGIPMTLIIDKKGVVQVVHVGFGADLEQSLSKEIEAVLAGKELAKEALETASESQRWGKPIPTGENALTIVDATELIFDFNLRTTVESYKEVGSRDDAWDELALEFLTEIARHFATAKGYKSRMELIAMGEPLIELGCDDPLVRYCLGAMLEDGSGEQTSRARGSRLVKKSYPALVERGYPANRCFASAERIWKRLKQKKKQLEKAEEFLQLTQDHARRVVLMDDLDGHDGRVLAGQLVSFSKSLPMEVRGEFCESLIVHENESPFIVNMVLGEYHLDLAWKSRGGGWAMDVTEEGWQGFEEHIAIARTCFEKAWESAPHRPNAPTAMVSLANASSQSPLREMRLWFDRAVQAQCDYRTPYHNLFSGLMPRWHGSHELIYQFGIECMETERFDTDIPYMLCQALWNIMQDSQNALGHNYMRKPGIYENVQYVCQGYINQEGKENDVHWWKTVWLGFAYLTDHWEDAGRLLEEIDGKLNANAMGRFPLSSEEVLSAIRINTSPYADIITNALERAERGDDQLAMESLTAVLAKEDLKPAVSNAIKSHMQGLTWSLRFDEELSVSLIPDRNLDGWRTAGGSWSQTDEGALSGVSDTGGVILECKSKFGTRWQLSGEIIHGKSPYNPWDAGLLLFVRNQPNYYVMFNPTEKWVTAGRLSKMREHRHPFSPTGKTHTFRIRIDNSTVNVWINDELILENFEDNYLGSLEPYRIALGAKYNWHGSELTYKNLRIEPLESAE